MLACRGLSFTDAYFEAMSGLTTTGSTVLSGLDRLPPSINLWRHLLHWIGGMGIIVLAVAILPLLGVGGMQLYKAETPGPMKDEKLTPRITETAKALWFIYMVITIACVLALQLAGMSWFDAVCHAFSAMALGGFSTHDASVGYFDSVPIELVLIVFHVVAAMNFATHFLAVRGRSLRVYARDPEAKAIVAVLAISCVVASLYLSAVGTYPDPGRRCGSRRFNVVSHRDDLRLSSTRTTGSGRSSCRCGCCCCPASSARGLDRRRHQDVPHAGAGAAVGREILLLVHPSAVMPRADRRPGDPQRDRVRRAGLHLSVLHDASSRLTFALLLDRPRFRLGVHGVVACINNAGPGLGAGRPGIELRRARRPADLDLHASP